MGCDSHTVFIISDYKVYVFMTADDVLRLLPERERAHIGIKIEIYESIKNKPATRSIVAGRFGLSKVQANRHIEKLVCAGHLNEPSEYGGKLTAN